MMIKPTPSIIRHFSRQ